ncbi:MAG: SusC/RagA family TonB-linked outer membrane protein, partial [Bacteroides sp.]
FEKNVPTYQTNMSIQGGTAKTRYYVSASYFYQDGLTPNSEYDRYTVRSNIDSQANDWLKFGLNIGGAYDHTQSALFTYNGSNNLNGGAMGSMAMLPYHNPYDEKGNKLDYVESMKFFSDEFVAKGQPSKTNTAQVNSSAFVEINPIEGLTVKSQVGLEAYDSRYTYKALPSFAETIGSVARRDESFSRNVKLTSTNTVEYKFAINDDHKFTALVGHEGVRGEAESFAARTTGQNHDFLTLLTAGTKADLAGTKQSKAEYNYLSFFGRIDYSWNDKYYLDFSIRNDASSRFGKDNRSATFASGGFMWNIGKESFMDEVDFITDLRFKGSVGSTGNSEIGNYDHLQLLGTTQYGGAGGWFLGSTGNPKLGWETQILTNVGFDVTFLDKYQFDFTYYRRKTKDMLMSVPLPYTTGFSSRMSNVGSMLNQGIEMSMNLTLYQDKDWFVGLNANYSYNKNKITKLFYNLDEWIIPGTSVSYIVGEPVKYYMPVFLGVDPEDGMQMWKDPSSEEGYTKDLGKMQRGELDMATDKLRYAPHSGGFSLVAAWKGLSLNADFSWVAGKYMVNNDRFFSENPALFAADSNQSKAILNEWKQPGDKTSVPKWGQERYFDTHLLEDASFLRLKNLGLSYQLPKSLLSKTNFFNSVKLNFNVRNLFTITPYKGADPEIDTNVSMGAYPNTRQISIGAEVTF